MSVYLNTFRSWCSTKVDSNNRHIGGEGNWGYCDDNCETTIFSCLPWELWCKDNKNTILGNPYLPVHIKIPSLMMTDIPHIEEDYIHDNADNGDNNDKNNINNNDDKDTNTINTEKVSKKESSSFNYLWLILIIGLAIIVTICGYGIHRKYWGADKCTTPIVSSETTAQL